MDAVSVRQISVETARVVRDIVLRPDHPLGGSVYPGDDAEDTLHLGAFGDGDLLGVATLCREAAVDPEGQDIWRLRGMATTQMGSRPRHRRSARQNLYRSRPTARGEVGVVQLTN